MRTILNLAIVGALLAVLPGCGREPVEDGTVRISASTTQLADIARNVAGDRATVVGILTPGSDPHEYEPRPSDAEALLDADLILQSGGEVDAWLEELAEASGSEATRLVALDSAEGEDPHWWQDPTAAIAVAEAIAAELAEVDPEGALAYEQNTARYVRRLAGLDRRIAACIRFAIPREQRLLVTSHDSLGRFADRYGLEVVGAAIPALTTQAQPSAGETAALVELIRDRDVPAVFPEAGVSAELEEAIAEEAGAEIGGVLYADALGPARLVGGTYIGALSVNTRRLTDALGGSPCFADVAFAGGRR